MRLRATLLVVALAFVVSTECVELQRVHKHGHDSYAPHAYSPGESSGGAVWLRSSSDAASWRQAALCCAASGLRNITATSACM
jgi:hypothetical protein